MLVDQAMQTSDAAVGQEFEARLYVIAPPASEPAWGEFLHDGFGTSFALTPSASNEALLVIRFSHYSVDR